MTVVDTFPDAEALGGAWLRGYGISGLGQRVYSSIPARPTYPLVKVRRVGGVPAERHRLDAANLQIDVYGNNQSEARDIAAAARTALFDMEGRAFSQTNGDPDDGFVTGVEDSLGLFSSQDPLSDKDRMTFGVTLYLHA